MTFPRFSRHPFSSLLSPLARTLTIASLAGGCLHAMALDKVVVYTNWMHQVEFGGYYAAKASGIYAANGLDVEIRPGGPQVNGSMLLLGGKADFVILHTNGQVISAAEQNLPLIAVAANYQKDPQVIVSHQGVGHDSLAALKRQPIFLSQDSKSSFWPWLKSKYGYTDSQSRPYTFQMAPFLSNPKAIQQSYLTAEPYALEKAGAKFNTFLLSDYGWNPTPQPLVTRKDLVEKNPELVKRFVRASMEGWYSFLADSTPARQLVKQLAPETTEAQMDFSIQAMRNNGIVLSGDALSQGIGVMSQAKWQSFYEQMSDLGLYKKGLDVSKMFTTQFVSDKTFVQAMQTKYPKAFSAPQAAAKP